MKYWKTHFFAISAVTGEIEKFEGMVVEAENIAQATTLIRESEASYLQLTGEVANKSQIIDVDIDEIFTEEDYRVIPIVEGLNFDEFYDWICLFKTEEGLRSLITLLASYPNKFKEKIKVIENRIKNQFEHGS